MRETVIINGISYDAKTGLPVELAGPKFDTPVPKSSPKKIAIRAPRKIAVANAAAKPSRAVRRPAPSQTLNRRFVAKPPLKTPKPKLMARPSAQPATAPSLRPSISTRPSPVAPRGLRRPSPLPTPQPDDLPPEEKRNLKLISLITAGVVVLAAAGALLSYLFIPAVSFWVASSRAEVKASLPTYTPSGFVADGRAQSSPGMVTLNYKSSAGQYSLQMANSNWDSDGVLENKVKPASTNYQTLNQKGLTIFVLKNQALWVNGGILYTLNFDNLNNSEILKIVDGI
jgi:hypothetical protein